MGKLLFGVFGTMFTLEVVAQYIPKYKHEKHPGAKLAEDISKRAAEFFDTLSGTFANYNK